MTRSTINPASLARFDCLDLEAEIRLVIVLMYSVVCSPIQHRAIPGGTLKMDVKKKCTIKHRSAF